MIPKGVAGRTRRSARVPQDPVLRHMYEPAGTPAAYREVRPTILLVTALLCLASASPAQPLTVERPTLPIPLRSYDAPTVPAVRLGNSPRLNRLIRAGKLYLTVQDALALAIENNLNLELDRYGPLLAQSTLERARAGGAIRGVPSASAQVSSVNAGVGVAGSALSAGLLTSSSTGAPTTTGGASIVQIGQVTPQLDPFIQSTTTFAHLTQPQNQYYLVSQVPSLIDSQRTYNTTLTQGLLTGGSVQFRNYEQYVRENTPLDLLNPAVGPHMDININQPLLQGFGVHLNDRFIRIGQVNVTAAGEQFRSQLIDLVTSVLNLYWDLAGDNDQLKARRQAVADAEQFLSDTQKEIAAGASPRSDLPVAQGQVARTRQELSIAQNKVGQDEALLKEALSRTEDPALEAAEIIPLDHADVPENGGVPPLREMLTTALQKRPDIALAKFREQTAAMGLSGTANPLLPTVVAFARIYNRGVAGEPQSVAGFKANPYFAGGYGAALGQIFRRDFPNNIGGVYLTTPIRNLQAQGDYGIDQLQFRQTQVSDQRALNQMVVDVSERVSALRQARAHYETARDSQRLQQQLLEADRKRFASGTALFTEIILDQRALVSAQISAITAESSYEHARVALDQVLGETLERNHIVLDEALKGEVSQRSDPPAASR